MNFFSLYSFTLYQYHEPKPHYFRWYSWTASHRQIITQYNGSIPWWLPWLYIFRALFPIRDLARYFPCAYATLSRQIHVCLETYSFHHVLAHTDIPSIITFCTHCRYIRFTSFNKFIKTHSIKDNFIK